MTIPEILQALEPYTGKFPKEAVQAAIEQREAITPELLRVLETVAEEPGAFAPRKKYMLHLFALFLLAQFREQRAYPLVVKIFSAPGEIPFDLVGDTITEDLDRIFASVYDGNPIPLKSLVENGEANEFVRAAALKAFVVLEHTGQMPRAEVVDYFRSLFHGKLPRDYSYAWDELVCVVADLPAPELLEEVRQAYAESLVDRTVAGLEEIEHDMNAPSPWRRERFTLIQDTIAEMENWACFRPQESTPRARSLLDQPAPLPALPQPPPPPASYVAPKPFVRAPKIGRNDPCPCGSGKKYKKCCGKG